MDILIHQPENGIFFNKILRLTLPGDGPACPVGSLEVEIDNIVNFKETSLHKRKSDGKLILCPRRVNYQMTDVPNQHCYSTPVNIDIIK